MSNSKAIVTSEKIRESKNLVHLYDTAIEKQAKLLQRVIKGSYKTTQVSDSVLYALVKGDLKLLEDKKLKVVEELEDLEKLSNSASADDPSDQPTSIDKSKSQSTYRR